MNVSEVSYDALVFEYTQGELFVALSFNSVVTLIVQVLGIVGVIKLAKACLGKSKNQV